MFTRFPRLGVVRVVLWFTSGFLKPLCLRYQCFLLFSVGFSLLTPDVIFDSSGIDW